MVVGAIKGIAPHPSDANTIYVSTVNGGIWKTTNGGGAWTAQTDTADSLSGGPIKFDPTDGTHNTLIAGIGNFSSLASAGGPQSGVLVTIDGATWTHPAGNAALTGTNINGVAAREYAVVSGTPQGILLVAADNGFYRSDDGGATFNNPVTNSGPVGLPAGKYFDLAEEPTANQIPDGVVMVSDGFGGVEEWSNNGTFLKSIFTGFGQDAGLAFDPLGNLYVTLFGGQGISKFDPHWNGTWGSGCGSGLQRT
jgi:hypothetical protein